MAKPLTLDRDNQLRNNGENFGTALFQHVENTLHREEAVGILLLTNTLEEDWQVMMVIELHNIDLPEDAVLGSVLNRDGEISTVVETSEFTGNDGTAVQGSSNWLLYNGLGHGFQKRSGLATNTGVALEGS